MEKFKEKWMEPSANKVIGSLTFVAGLITFIAGFGAWANPHLDWEVFKQSIVTIWVTIANEIARFLTDPFAFIGLIVMIVSTFAMRIGIRKILNRP